MIDLTGRHIFVVGGSRGIGAAAARMAAKAGARVSVNYVSNGEAAQRVAADITADGGQSFAFQADAAEEGALDAAVRESVARLGPLHGMVVSAGIFEGLPIEEMTGAFWDRVMSVNLRGTFLAVRAIVPHLRSSGVGGSVVIYTSTAGQRGS
ncbi:MAG TPA: SDR family NAD(P)-dependent oxidoreductase, partial [Chthonomonadaceae bacterium]|nr:SDR family NAD(P)-dependent oxidoreductase [Chthonomonadaceae bacterium]